MFAPDPTVDQSCGETRRAVNRHPIFIGSSIVATTSLPNRITELRKFSELPVSSLRSDFISQVLCQLIDEVQRLTTRIIDPGTLVPAFLDEST